MPGAQELQLRRAGIFLFLILLLIGPAGAREPSGARERVLVIGCEADYPPFSFTDDAGETVGFSIDLTRAIAELMGFRVELRVAPWREIRSRLEAGEIDAVAGMFFSSQRDQKVDFSQPFAEIHQSIFYRSGEPAASNISDLTGKSIIVMRDDIMDDHLSAEGFSASLIRTDTLAEALTLFFAGQGDYLAGARLPVLHYLKEHAVRGIEAGGDLYHETEYCFAVPEGRRELLTTFIEGLSILKQRGEYRKLYDRWIGPLEPRAIDMLDALRYASYVVGPLLLVAAAALMWVRLMRRQVARRTAELSAEIRRRDTAEARLAQINRVLEAVSRVNQLIVRESERSSMMRRICGTLTETRGYYNAWIALFDKDGSFSDFFESGLGEGSRPMRELLESGDLPDCGRYAMDRDSAYSMMRPSESCRHCPLAGSYEDRCAYSVPLRYLGRSFGFLTVSLPSLFFGDKDEEELLNALGEDVAYALHSLELREEREEMARRLLQADKIVRNSRIVLFRWELSSGWPVSYVSENVSRFGYCAADFLDGSVLYGDIVHPQDRIRVSEEVEQAVREKKESFTQEYRLVDPQGRTFWVEDRTRIILDESGEVLAAEGTVIDITEKMEALDELRRRDARLNAIIESAEDMIFLKDSSLSYTHVNSAYLRFIARDRDQLIGLTDEDILGAQSARESRIMDQRVLGGEPCREEYTLHSAGRQRNLETIRVPVRDDSGDIIGICAISRDITDAVRVRRQLEQALDEKSTLLRELYHRTKNTMQVIASMVAMRRFGLEDGSMQDVLQDIEAKIHSMALVHHRLYESENLSRIDLKEYILELTELVRNTFEDETKGIRFRYNLESVESLVDVAVPLGLVVNELLVNAVRHAFPEGSAGWIEIGLQNLAGEGVLLTLSDNGVGLPEDFDPLSQKTLGLTLVYSIVETQLNGRMEYIRGKGTRWELRLGPVAYEERV